MLNGLNNAVIVINVNARRNRMQYVHFENDHRNVHYTLETEIKIFECIVVSGHYDNSLIQTKFCHFVCVFNGIFLFKNVNLIINKYLTETYENFKYISICG